MRQVVEDSKLGRCGDGTLKKKKKERRKDIKRQCYIICIVYVGVKKTYYKFSKIEKKTYYKSEMCKLYFVHCFIFSILFYFSFVFNICRL
jgi:hypothetical protein